MQLSGISSTPSINGILNRNLALSLVADSSTPDVEALLITVRQLVMALLSESSTPAVDHILSRELGLELISESITPAIDHILDRSLVMNLQAQTLTPDQVGIVLSGLGVIIDPGITTLTRRRSVVSL
jgi:hypothetical protein